MKIIGSVTVDKKDIKFFEVPLDTILQRYGFRGQKMFHVFDFEKEVVSYTKTWGKGRKKRKEEVTRTYLHYKDGYADLNAQKALTDPTAIFEVKFDGGCGYMLYDESAGKYVPYTRRDVKKDASGKWKACEDTWIPCEPEPTVPEANHWPHMVPCYEDPNSYKWMIQAFNNVEQSGVLEGYKKSFTIEWMGKKCNPCKTDPIDEDMVIVPHGSIRVEIPMDFRNYSGMKQLLTQIPFIEGLVCYSQHGVFKIRRDLFWSDTDPKRNLSWGRMPIAECAGIGTGFDFANGHGLAHYVKMADPNFKNFQYVPDHLKESKELMMTAIDSTPKKDLITTN